MMSDPFAEFSLDRRFDLDAQALRQAYLARSAQVHPDRFTDPLEQADAVEHMSRLTDAYRVLCDPQLRAKALLALSGLEAEGDRDKLPPDLLMQMMEVREEMESAIESRNQTELERLRGWATQQRDQYLAGLARDFEQKLDVASAAQIRMKLNALRYMQRMLEQMPSASQAD